MNITVDELQKKVFSQYTIVENADGTIIMKPIINKIKIQNYNMLNDYNFTFSNIIYCNIKYNNQIYTIDNPKYRSILMQMYNIIDDGTTIIKNTLINIKTKIFEDNGFSYIPELGISIQGIDSNKCIKEIYHQASCNNIQIEISVELKNSSKYIFYN
jgi:hypothetical protein